jgi:choline-glycine betaine transporter
VKLANNVVIIGTCAFTAHLLLQNLPFYVPSIGEPARYGVVALAVLLSVLTSTHIRYVRVLSVWSMWLFGALVASMWLVSGMGVRGFLSSAADIGPYFSNLPRFASPISDYHAFYLFWWFSWSIMIGQFVSRFVGGMRTWHLAVALLVVPSIPLAAWFSVLYFYYRQGATVHPVLTVAMVVVGILFVINSLDSLIRLYSDNLGLTARRLGTARYVAAHWLLMYALVLAFQFTPLKIEWIGLVVIGLYAAVYVLLLRRLGSRRG